MNQLYGHFGFGIQAAVCGAVELNRILHLTVDKILNTGKHI